MWDFLLCVYESICNILEPIAVYLEIKKDAQAFHVAAKSLPKRCSIYYYDKRRRIINFVEKLSITQRIYKLDAYYNPRG